MRSADQAQRIFEIASQWNTLANVDRNHRGRDGRLVFDRGNVIDREAVNRRFELCFNLTPMTMSISTTRKHEE